MSMPNRNETAAGRVRSTPATAAKALFTLASNAAMVWFLLRGGLSTLGVLVIIAAESLLLTAIAIAVQATEEALRSTGDARRGRWGRLITDIALRCAVLILVFGGIMALFFSAIVFVAPAAEPLEIISPAFRETVVYVALATLGHGLVDLLRVLDRTPGHLLRIQSNAFFHLLIGTLVATFGAALVLLMQQPMLTLDALIVVKTAADLVVDWLMRNALKSPNRRQTAP